MYTFNSLDLITKDIKAAKTKLIYVAGASASGKSYFADLLKEKLEQEGKKVLAISSDSYYMSDSGLKYMLYGTFDHPALIEYSLLAKNIDEYFTTGKTTTPEYSFKERRRVAYHDVTEAYDYVIVEGLYAISLLPNKHNPFKIFVHSHLEELIFRRLVRDQKRINEPMHMIVDIITKVFPMWNLYGKKQKNKSDLVVYNDYDILSVEGEKAHYSPIKKQKAAEFGRLKNKWHIVDFEYDDKSEENGRIIISEVYRSKGGLLDHVSITKRNSHQGQHREYSSIMIDLYQPGVLTGLHTLMQLAGLRMRKSVKKIVSEYEKDGKTVIIKSRRGKMYQRVVK